MNRPPLEVADIVHQYGAAFLAHYGATLSSEQHRALRAIARCRTAALGGHKAQCDQCGHEELSYNSCRNRHCSKCHGAAQAVWLAAREREVLDVPYVHVVFTLPHTLSALSLHNPRVLYGMLFCTVAQMLQDIAGDSKHLGADLAVAWRCSIPGVSNSTITRISTVSSPLGAWRPRGLGGSPVAHTFSSR
jgi:hypothetical protein